MFTEEELRAMKLKDLQTLKRGWVVVGKVAFSTGAQWQAVFAKEGRGKPNAEGGCCLVKEDYILGLLAAMSSYRELIQGCEQHQGDTCAPAAAPVAEPAQDPVAALVDLVPAPAPVAAAAPAPARAPVPAQTRDPNKRTSKRPQQYDPLFDGASDQMRLGVAKPKKLRTRKR